MKKRLLAAFMSASLLMGLCLTGCSNVSKADTSDTLRVGVRDDIINFGFYSEAAEKYYGLEIDLAQELSDRLGYQDIEFISVKPDTRKDTLLNGEVDCLIAAYSISDTRLENFDFSPPYYTDSTSLMVERSSLLNNIEDLKGKTAGVLSGANSGPVLAIKLHELGLISETVISSTDTETVYDNLRVVKYPTYAELSQALEEGTVDVICMDECILATYMDENRKLIEADIYDQQYGVATQKDSELSKPVSDTVQEMLDDGTIDKLVKKWS